MAGEIIVHVKHLLCARQYFYKFFTVVKTKFELSKYPLASITNIARLDFIIFLCLVLKCCLCVKTCL